MYNKMFKVTRLQIIRFCFECDKGASKAEAARKAGLGGSYHATIKKLESKGIISVDRATGKHKVKPFDKFSRESEFTTSAYALSKAELQQFNSWFGRPANYTYDGEPDTSNEDTKPEEGEYASTEVGQTEEQRVPESGDMVFDSSPATELGAWQAKHRYGVAPQPVSAVSLPGAATAKSSGVKIIEVPTIPEFITDKDCLNRIEALLALQRPEDRPDTKMKFKELACEIFKQSLK